MSITIPFDLLRDSAGGLRRTAGDIEDELASVLNRCYAAGPTMQDVVIRIPQVLDATGERLAEHVRDFAGTVDDAADEVERLDNQIGGNGGG